MGKLPVFRTIGTAYRFVFSEFPTILRLTWFPLIVVAVVNYGLMAIGVTYRTPGVPPWPMALLASLLAVVVGIIAPVIVAVAIHRLILFNDRKPGTIALFSFHRAELLFLAAMVVLLLGVLVAAALPGAILAAAVVAARGGGNPAPLAKIAGSVGLLVVILASLYVFVRLLLVFPIIVVENALRFHESWGLTRGRFWRLFWVNLLGLLPFVVVTLIVQAIIVRVILDPSSPAATLQSLHRAQALQLACQFVLGLFVSGIEVALICFSYKSLRGLPPDALVSGPSSVPGTNATAAPQA